MITVIYCNYIKKKEKVTQMNIRTKAIVSNSDMIKNYKSCRDKAESFGKIFVLKNNQPDAVLFSIAEYERLSVFIEYLESLDENDIVTFIESLPKEGIRKRYSMDHLKNDIK
jgi:PHD/YefM family antitoxin component YafN of YafNO toxin-antitoxin module